MSFHESISLEIWETKYRYVLDNKIRETSITETWQRVARAIALGENSHERQMWENKFYDLVTDFKFLPGGRILAGAGTQHNVTLFNCFVMQIAKDSLSQIFSALKEGALTLQEGGGVGYDFSVLRPKGALAKRTGILASGPVSFMKIWNTTCGILLSTGARRGAMMGVLRCDHPDIVQFINAKKDAAELRHFNVSVLISDAFMKAVNNDEVWPLVFKKKIYQVIKAKDLWEQIIKSSYDYAEPGVLFEDTINRQNTLHYCEHISATNPCGEIPLPPYGACNLGSLNLTQFIHHPFEGSATLDWHALENAAMIATRFLDNVIDVSRFPLVIQKKQANNTRRIGLGITGLGSALVMLGIKYGSEASYQFAQDVMCRIAEVTWDTSVELARERGSFVLFAAKDYLRGEFLQNVSEAIKNKIAKYGMRNSHHNTIAPAGTISLLANNISSGIEPIFQDQYSRYVIDSSGERKKYDVTEYCMRLWQQTKPNTKYPHAWVHAHDIAPQQHLKMQAALQPYIDNAISKTINIPTDFPFEQLRDIYARAYEMKLKGCTIFRPNAITGNVLESVPPEELVERCCQLS